MLRTALPCIAAASALALSACGGGGGDKLSKADLGKKANGICKDFSAKVSKLKQPSGAGDVASLTSYFDQARQLAEDQQSALAKLKPADDVKDDWNDFLDKDKSGTDLLGQLATATKKKDTKSATSLLTKINAVTDDINSSAKKVGATGCGSGAA